MVAFPNADGHPYRFFAFVHEFSCFILFGNGCGTDFRECPLSFQRSCFRFFRNFSQFFVQFQFVGSQRAIFGCFGALFILAASIRSCFPHDRIEHHPILGINLSFGFTIPELTMRGTSAVSSADFWQQESFISQKENRLAMAVFNLDCFAFRRFFKLRIQTSGQNRQRECRFDSGEILHVKG